MQPSLSGSCPITAAVQAVARVTTFLKYMRKASDSHCRATLIKSNDLLAIWSAMHAPTQIKCNVYCAKLLLILQIVDAGDKVAEGCLNQV